MLNERLQILVTTEQRRRLEAEARERGKSVGELIRDAVDARYPGGTRAERLRAAEEIRGMRAGPMPDPDELNRLIAEEHARGLPRPRPRRR